MKSVYILIATVIGLSVAELQGAKYAGEPFALGAGGRPLALGGAYVALSDDPSGVYYNPAGLSLISRTEAILMHSETFGSLVNHDFLALAKPTRISRFQGSLAFGLYRVGGGGIIYTERTPEGSPKIISDETHNDFQMLIGGGVRLSDNFRVGGTAKMFFRSLKDHNGYGLSLDVGGQYGRPEALVIGAAIADVTTGFVSYQNSSSETILPSLRLGAKYTRTFEQFELMAIGETETQFESRDEAAQVSLGAVSIDGHFGAEVSFQRLIYLRAGSDAGDLTLGFGLKVSRFGLDGALHDNDSLDDSYRMSLTISL